MPTITDAMTPESLRFELFARDVDATANFLKMVLGFVTTRAEPSYRELRLGAVTIGLGSVDGLPDGHPLKPHAGERIGLGVEVVIETDDVDAAYARAQEAKANIETPLGLRSWGQRDFRVLSPDGYYFRISSR